MQVLREELTTDWILLDMELMPWSAKAGELLLTQYAAVGSSGRAVLRNGDPGSRRRRAIAGSMSEICSRAPEPRGALIEGYRRAYRHYCWEVNSVDDLRIAPFHVLASEGAVHINKDQHLALGRWLE